MKDKATYGAIGLFAVVAFFALLGQIAGNSSSVARQFESIIAAGLIGVNCVLNALIWWFLPPKKLASLLHSAGRFLIALILAASTIVVVAAVFFIIASIRTNDLRLFGGDSGFAFFGVLGGSIFCSALSSIVYLIAQAIVPKIVSSH